MSKGDVKHTAKINNNDYKIIEVEDKYIVAKPINTFDPTASGAHICYNTGSHHFDNMGGKPPLYIYQDYNQTGSIAIASGAYILPISVQNNEIILLPKKPISELNYSQGKEGINLSVNANGWIVALAKNKETIDEVKEKIDKYNKENVG